MNQGEEKGGGVPAPSTVAQLVAKWHLNPRCGAPAIGDGWVPLVDALIEDLVRRGLDPAKDIAQIKEKFGALRVYLNKSTREMEALIGCAEIASAHTCEQCGAEAKTHSDGWCQTLCNACWEKKQTGAKP